MNKNILVITDKVNCTWPDLALKNYDKSCNFDILNLGLNGEVPHHIYKEKYSRLSSFRIIDINPFADSSQEKIRKFIPSFIYEFPRNEIFPDTSLMKFFRVTNKINLWWFMEMSEKGPLRTPFIKRMYYLELIKNTILKEDYQEIWLELEDKELSELIIANKNKFPSIKNVSQKTRPSKFLNRNLFWMKLFFVTYKLQFDYFVRRIMIKMMGIDKRETMPNKSILFFSFFPYFWIKSSKLGFLENFFRSAPKQISKWAPVHYAVWLTFSNPFLICKNRKEIRENFRKLNMISIESYLNLKDFFYVFLFSMQYIDKILKYRLNIQPRIKVSYEGFDITNIVVDELNQSLLSSEIFSSILIERSVENMVSKNKISAIIYRTEFQPHERAIEYGASDRCMTFAFQHQAIGRNHLQYFFAKNEIAQYYSAKNDLDNLPLPDKILVTGEYPFEVLKNAGFHEKDIGICGPVRYAGLVEYKKSGKTKSGIRKKYGYNDNQHIFLVASPSLKEEMLNLILSLVHALKEEGDNFIFLFKSHPVYKFDKEIIDIINEFYPKMNYSFLTDDVNLNDYLALSDALILTGTTVGIEAICLGTIPILFENNSTFSVNPLLEIKNSYLSVNNSQELKEALFSVINNDVKILELKKHWPEAIKKLFYNIDEDPNVKFSSFIKNYIK